MQIDRLRLIGGDCPAYAGDFAMTQQTARALVVRDIERDAACARVRSELRDTQAQLTKARWWDDNGPTVVVGGVALSFVAGGAGGFVLAEGIRK